MAAIPRFGTRVVPDISAIIDGCRSRRQLVQGPDIAAFEEEFGRFLGSGHVRACSTEYGRMALYFILKAMDLPAGAGNIVPARTFLGGAGKGRAARPGPVVARGGPAAFS